MTRHHPESCVMTQVREAEIRAAIADGRWGIVVREHEHMPEMTCRVWFGTDDTLEGIRYSSWLEESPERMRQLVERAGYGDELLRLVDSLRSTLTERDAEVATYRENARLAEAERETLMAKLDEAEGVLGEIAESLGVQAQDEPDLSGIMHEIDEAVPQYTCDTEGSPSTTLAERIGFLVQDAADFLVQDAAERDAERAMADARAEGMRLLADDTIEPLERLLDALDEMHDPDAEAGTWMGMTRDDLRECLSNMKALPRSAPT